MFNSKYSNILTAMLVIVIIAIVGLIGFLGYDIYKKYYIDKDAEAFIEQYENQISNNDDVIGEYQGNNEITNTYIDPGQSIGQGNNSSSGGNNSNKYTYKGFGVLGTIQIPKTGINYPVLNTYTPKGLETSVCYYFGPGLNEVGNTTIAGHNYRNGAFFGKNKKLANGDAIYITDNLGNKVKYTIYNIYTTTPNDGEYLTRDTEGKREISLTTCTDDSKGRLIIWARES